MIICHLFSILSKEKRPDFTKVKYNKKNCIKMMGFCAEVDVHESD